MSQHSESILTDDDEDAEFTDAIDESIFSDSEHPSISPSSSLYELDNPNHDSISLLPDSPESISSPYSPGLRRRRRKSSAAVQSRARVRVSSGTEEIDRNIMNSRAIITLTDDVSVNDRSVTVNSPNPNSGSNFVFTMARLIIWLTHSSHMFVKHDIIIIILRFLKICLHKIKWIIYNCIRRKIIILKICLHIIKRIIHDCIERKIVILKCCLHVIKRIIHDCIERKIAILKCCWHIIKRILCDCIERKKSILKICLQIGWGLLCSVFVGLVLVGLLVCSFIIGGVLMKCVMEAPVSKVAQLNFDYTRDSPVAFVPITGSSCHEPVCLGCVEKIGFGNVARSRVFPRDHKLRATVSLTLPESGYNRNLGNFQVRVDILSSNGKFLASATQPCAMQFKSGPIRLLMTVFKLALLITGYSSESQTVHIKFNQYTEREIPTSCMRVVLEPRAGFAKGRGVPEIYTGYLKLESQLPFLKRVLWSWKVTVFVWTSIAIFMLVVVIMLLCCGPWLRLKAGGPLDNTEVSDPGISLLAVVR